MKLETIILSSLHKVYPLSCPKTPLTALSGMRNEPLSFQLAYKLEEGSEKHTTPIYPRIETDLDLNLYSVGYVPVLHTDIGIPDMPAPGLIGDMLLPKAVNPELEHKGYPWKTLYFEKDEKITLNAANDAWQALWFTVNENGKSIAPGKYTVRIALYESYDGEKIGENEIEITIVDAELPKQKLKYTNWFHCDCLADFYNVEIFSDSFFEIMRAQVACAVKNGMNMILTPFFTPPLDTPVDDERMTAQLVKVNVINGVYSFDFSLLKKFIDICREEGMEYFEHSHLFTQWGSKAAPKVIACVDGVEKRIFGWDTPATGDEYTAFLDAYLPAVKKFLAGENLSDKILFHVSDEPTEDNAEQYRKAKAVVSKHLKGYLCGDALSHYLFYEEGLVETPIVATHNIDDFLGRCEHLWAYYTGGQIHNGRSNRLIVFPSERNRVIGLSMYAHKIEGFLHWAYNNYYDLLSQGLFDPAINPCGYNNNPGTTYMVYPGRDGKPIQSTRQKNFAEGILDIRALELLESLSGRKACDEIMEKHFGKVGFDVVPNGPEHLIAFREDVNAAIQKAL